MIKISDIMSEALPAEQLEGLRLPEVTLDPTSIKAIMINEIVPQNPEDDFHGSNTPPAYLTTTLPLFRMAGFPAKSMDEITARGIYITNAVKEPKPSTTIANEMQNRSLPILERELFLFPNLRVIMLMGDVAKKMVNRIIRARDKITLVPAISTYKLRETEIHYGDIRVFPSYIMTGKNILIEKSKVDMASDDLRRMLDIIDS